MSSKLTSFPSGTGASCVIQCQSTRVCPKKTHCMSPARAEPWDAHTVSATWLWGDTHRSQWLLLSPSAHMSGLLAENEQISKECAHSLSTRRGRAACGRLLCSSCKALSEEGVTAELWEFMVPWYWPAYSHLEPAREMCPQQKLLMRQAEITSAVQTGPFLTDREVISRTWGNSALILH